MLSRPLLVSIDRFGGWWGRERCHPTVLQVLTTIRDAWRWTGLDPAQVVAVNAFGNVIVRAVDGTFWRICPEELSCKVIAGDAESYAALFEDGEFRIEWQMHRLVELAAAKLG